MADTPDPAALDDAAPDDALQLLFDGHVDQVLPEEEIAEFHDFIREDALMRRRFAVSFRLECRCLAWIGYSLANIVTHEDGIESPPDPSRPTSPTTNPTSNTPKARPKTRPTNSSPGPSGRSKSTRTNSKISTKTKTKTMAVTKTRKPRERER